MKEKKKKVGKEDDEGAKQENVIKSWWWLLQLAWEIATVLLIIYAAGVAMVLYSTSIKMEIIFSNRINPLWSANLTDCQSFGLLKCENMYLDGKAGKLGAWLISPGSPQYITRGAYFIYLHGNMGSRAMEHRVQLYKRLSKMGYHILAVDYRGFGDSDGWPTEIGLLEDGLVAYDWIRERSKGLPIYIWGHSLGSAIAVRLAHRLNQDKKLLNGVIFESGFNNITDAIMRSPLAFPASAILPNFESYLDDVKYTLRTSYWIQQVTSPIMMYHDISDHIIDINLARKLFLHAKEVGSGNVNIIEFDEELYHQDIYRAKNIKPLVREFVRNTS